MRRLSVIPFVLITLISCSKNEEQPTQPVVIPNIITGAINEIAVTPLNITTPDKGLFTITANNTIYKVEFDATDQVQSNADLHFDTDTILTGESREFANLGRNAIAYYPVKDNLITIHFKDGRKVTGSFNFNTSFGGVFGEQLISQWRDPADPAKPTQKAKDDIINFIHRYSDKDGPGPGPGTVPVYLLVTVSRQ